MPHVLVVDDDNATRQMLRCVLEDEGHVVREAGDGMAALAILRVSAGPLVVLLDWMMPRLRGDAMLAVVAQERDLAARHAYILMTASGPGWLPGCADLLARLRVPVVQKPFDLEKLLDMVAQAAQRLPQCTALASAAR